MPTSEPELAELDGPASACDDAAAAVCEDFAADRLEDIDVADRPTASAEVLACNPSSVVEAALSEATDGTLVRVIESGFTVI